MVWTIDYTQTAKRQLQQVDRPVAQRVVNFLDDRVAKQDDPRSLGKALTGPLGTLWRYRIGDYRAMCDIDDRITRVLVLQVGHRREVYR